METDPVRGFTFAVSQGTTTTSSSSGGDLPAANSESSKKKVLAVPDVCPFS
jgi:hypothetical protein